MRLVVGSWTLLCVQGRHREQPLAECRIFPNLEAPCLRGKASGALQLSTSSPSVFSHLCICCETE